MGRSFDELPKLSCKDMRAAFAEEMKPGAPNRLRAACFATAFFFGSVGVAAGLLPVLEAGFRCLFGPSRLSCLWGLFRGCFWHGLLWRGVGGGVALGLLHGLGFHVLVFGGLFMFDMGVHQRSPHIQRRKAKDMATGTLLSAEEFELARLFWRRKQEKMILTSSKLRPTIDFRMDSPRSLLLCVDQWQPAAVVVLTVLSALLLVTRDSGRCDSPAGAHEHCCSATWVGEGRADVVLIWALAVALPLTAVSMLAFDTVEPFLREWSEAEGFDDPIPFDPDGQRLSTVPDDGGQRAVFANERQKGPNPDGGVNVRPAILANAAKPSAA